ncbi:MAG TPA: beta-N-acetylhexosaminidase, partial [Flavitalea sp.]|nr:beta-N-acetylhexosaminidase [Flavitalea sp.]
MKKITFLLLAVICVRTSGQTVNITPAPVKVTPQKGTFTITKSTVLVLNDDAEKASAEFLNIYLNKIYGFSLQVSESATTNYIRFTTRRFVQAPENPGKYNMQVKPDGINIEGDSYQGTFYGLQSLIQLLPPSKSQSFTIPCVSIEDYPRFQYRGLHLDVGRHFFPVDFVKKYIDYIALHKLNYFHWHLTEDQGWRIEIKKYPRLTSVGGFRNGTIIGRYPGKGNDNIPYGGFYTQGEIKDVVAYAEKRFVTVVPEIEMPGHGSAAIAAYPWLSCFPDQKTKIPDNMISNTSRQATGKLVQETWGVFDDVFCAGNDSTFAFLEDVIDEIITLFPSKYIHIGGDECPKTHWKICPRCQQRMKDLKLKDEHELQSYFIQRMEKYINGKGKTIIGWDEILEGGLAPNALVMSWRGEQGGIEAAKQNHQVIMTPGNYVYFDHTQRKNEDSVTIGGFTPVEEVYGYEPLPKELSADKYKFILGAQANVWTEYMKNTRKVEYMIFPRLSALSEILWSPKEKRNSKDFERRLPTHFKRYELWGANYSNAYYDISASIKPSPTYDGLIWSLQSKGLDKNSQIRISTDNIEAQNPTSKTSGAAGDYRIFTYSKPLVITKSSQYNASLLIKNQNGTQQECCGVQQRFYLNKATGKKISLSAEPSTTYPGNTGAFGLINGVLSERGFNSPEWLGWLGTDMEAVIDLVKPVSVSSVQVHSLDQSQSQIWLPASVEVSVSSDGKNFTSVGSGSKFEKDSSGFATGFFNVEFSPTTTRYIKVIAKSHGVIAEGNRFAGSKAWV